MLRRKKERTGKLVAVAGRDGDLVAAFGAAAAEHGGAGLGGHAAEEAVNLAPAAAIGLKGALGHRGVSLFEKNPEGLLSLMPA